jgi:micrococcal nuclease
MSRRRRFIVFALCLLAVFVLIWLDHSPLRCAWQGQPESEEQVKTSDFERYHEKTFSVVNIVDGDTLDIGIPDGKNDYTRIRLLGIDTPETSHPQGGTLYFGPEAAEFAAELALGKRVRIYLEEDRTRGKYGRLLAYVQLPDNTVLNEILLTEGFAYAYLPFRHSFYHKYKQLEAVARGRKKGLWRQVTRQQLPEWLQRRKPKLLLEK